MELLFRFSVKQEERVEWKCNGSVKAKSEAWQDTRWQYFAINLTNLTASGRKTVHVKKIHC